MDLLAENNNEEPVRYSQLLLKTPDIQLDLYKIARKRGLLAQHMTIQLRQFLATGFNIMVGKLHDLDPRMHNGSIFPQTKYDTVRPCFNYMSQWLRLSLLKCLALCLPEESRAELDAPGLYKLDNPDWLPLYKKIYGYLALLRAPAVILWFFFQVPNYCNYDIKGFRQVYTAMCDYIIANWSPALCFSSSSKKPDKPVLSFEQATLGTTFYYNMVYHGQSNKDILAGFVKVLNTVYPELLYTAPHISQVITPARYNLKQDKGGLLKKCLDLYEQKYIKSTQSNQWSSSIVHNLDKLGEKSYRKIKIVFISQKLAAYTSVFRDRIGIITNLDRAYFEPWIALFGDEKVIRASLSTDRVVLHYLDTFLKQNRVIFLSKINVVSNQTIIADHAFDIIIYPDLGMVQAQTLLAHARLAPIQITTWGHSDTSGNPEIDYYITSKWFEQTEDLAVPKRNYSEKPVLLSSLGTYYYSPRKVMNEIMAPGMGPESKFLRAIDLGFAGTREPIIIGCLQSFYKFNPEFEAVIETIMKLTEPMSRGGHPVYLALSNSITFNKLHLSRLNKRLGPYTERIKWFQNKSPVEWLNLVSICHVMIDPFPFGGCNTTLEAFDYGIPVVCYPSKTMINGRFTAGFYRKMGIMSCITESPAHFVQQVIRLIQDNIYYEYVKKEILAAKECLFEEKESLLEYQNVLYNLANKHLVISSN